MRQFLYIAPFILLFAACKPTNPVEPVGPVDPVDPDEPKGRVVLFTESKELFPNPERGLFTQVYYTSADLNFYANAENIKRQRTASDKKTLYLHSYYLTDYLECDIPQAFLDRLDSNMNALRVGGAKAVVRFSYKSSMEYGDKPWNATPEWIHKHIDQVTPYLQKNADVILCAQCGWLGSWGEWYYTDSGYKMNPTKDEDFAMRWEVLEHMLRALPEDRQVALRIPAYKMRWLKMHGDANSTPLSAAEAHNGSIKARIAGHNDCFVSSSNDVGTYTVSGDREFWAADTKYTLMGGETCKKRAPYSDGGYALKEMAKYHWTYLNGGYQEQITGQWRVDGTMDSVIARLGYRLVLDKAVLTEKPKTGEKFEAYFKLRNVGFAAPMNKRGLELILVSTGDPNKKYIYPQIVDPRFWLPEEVHKFTLLAMLTDVAPGEYKLYLNLPDPYESLHDDPRFSIRIANANMWEETTGYNYIATINVE